MSHGTQVAVVTLAVLAGMIYGWRRWGLLGALVIAVAASALAGAYVPAIHSAVVSLAELAKTPSDLVLRIVH